MFCSSSSTATNLYTSSKTSRGTSGREERVEVEAKALVKWKESLDNQTHVSDILSSWKLFPSSSNITRRGNISLCQWFGITCNEFGSVLYINLESRNLKGTLQNFNFSSFPYIESFTLYNNSLYGTIPPQISNISRLVYLDLSSNQLSGNIPVEIFLLQNLSVLYLDGNNLNGSIPHEVGMLRSIEEIFFRNNSLSGPIPTSLGIITSNLTYIDLSRNKFSGSIPQEIGKLKNLNQLYMERNNLTGSIPMSIGNFTNLILINLAFNQISGSIPHEIGFLESIQELYLYGNHLTGSIPASIGKLKSLVALLLFDNNLTGTIPLEMNNLIHFDSLQLDNNFLHGSLPDNICLGGKLRWFSAAYNQFEGQLPKSMRNCTSLQSVYLDGNRLAGNISEELGIYPNLKFMKLSRNNFFGELSGNWGECRNLTALSISDNRISGRLIPELGNAAQLRKLDLSSNLLAGKIPKELGRLKFLFFLNLSNNTIFGKIPMEIGMLSELQQLDLGANKLSGLIPMQLGQCSKLQLLNLKNNSFSGTVPFQIGKLQSLRDLDLSMNLLIGELPMEFRNLRMLETLNLSHNNLSGKIPSVLDDMISLTFVDVSYNQLEGPLPNLKAFIEAPELALENNKGLCGNNTSLKPCSTSKENSNKVVLSLIVSVSGTLFLLFAIFGVLFIRQKIKKNKFVPRETQVFQTFFAAWRHDGKKVYEEIVEATENFDSKYCIGVGGNGSVYKTLLSNGQVIAVKNFHENGQAASQQAFKSETSLLTGLRHRNIIKLYGFCSHRKHSSLVYEFMENGSFVQILNDYGKAIDLEWTKRVNVIRGLANAMYYLHHECFPAIIHRDISSKNVLLDSEYEAHISKFGSAIICDPESSNWTSSAGTFGYVAPELDCTMEINKKSDVYNFGVVTMEALLGKHPGDLISYLSSSSSSFAAAASEILLMDVLDPRLPLPTMQVAAQVASIVEIALACLHPIPQSRPTMKQVSDKLSTTTPLPSLSRPIHTITLKQLIDPPSRITS
ncbi:MDIS1-interacting receptor like kinase 2-like [Ziziphus jujuba]|uniref:non-specific serine/threonine protein kinase n=1 Tax=Ziziphus jujuba TaxID=326968 RepID=A0ABM4AAU4_ZIZJJ|nr:MDIS1-interacting receptor like kinase 2-like [Ziziphus jujuba]